ncbi:MAG: peptidoglycan-binding protein [Erysipelotrichales bacterium]|nr:peptidoglycan-binding protein [Erysipelotrichales bacterium]
MGYGHLIVQVDTGDEALPVHGATVLIRDGGGNVLHKLLTDADGRTVSVKLYAPDKYHTLDPNDAGPFYSVYDVEVRLDGKFKTRIIHDVEIFDTEETVLPVHLHPLTDGKDDIEEITIPKPDILNNTEVKEEQRDIVPYLPRDVIIPEFITVKLGRPDSTARTVRVRFPEYIKNVASSEIFPTWPEAALEANIIAQISFALNRVFTEWYRSRGYNFDITNSTAVDQAYVDGRNIFANISQIVDRLFTSFARRQGRLEPFFTQYCNGTTVTCSGLSQWGTVPLANRGMTPLQILRNYYPNDIQIVTSDNIQNIAESYPGTALREGSSGADVRMLQQYLNRIRVNYPLIPQVNPNGQFDAATKRAVETFQGIFNLTKDGIVGRATWYRIVQLYVAVTRLAAMDSEGKWIGLGATPPTATIREGSRGSNVTKLQYLLNYISEFYETIDPVIQDSSFRKSTTDSVRAFQKQFGLNADGIVGPNTWRKLYQVYESISKNAPVPPSPGSPNVSEPYPGTLIRLGSTGNSVRIIQEALNAVGSVRPSIQRLSVDGIFGPMTQNAVREFQRLFGLQTDGIVGPATWERLIRERNNTIK